MLCRGIYHPRAILVIGIVEPFAIRLFAFFGPPPNGSGRISKTGVGLYSGIKKLPSLMADLASTPATDNRRLYLPSRPTAHDSHRYYSYLDDLASVPTRYPYYAMFLVGRCGEIPLMRSRFPPKGARGRALPPSVTAGPPRCLLPGSSPSGRPSPLPSLSVAVSVRPRLCGPRPPVVVGGVLPSTPVMRTPPLSVPLPVMGACSPCPRPWNLQRLPLPVSTLPPSPSDADDLVSGSGAAKAVPSRAEVTPALDICSCTSPSSPVPSVLLLAVPSCSGGSFLIGFLPTPRKPSSYRADQTKEVSSLR